jgi:hypothetical protein
MHLRPQEKNFIIMGHCGDNQDLLVTIQSVVLIFLRLLKL